MIDEVGVSEGAIYDEYDGINNDEYNMQQMAEMLFTWSADSGSSEGGEGEGDGGSGSDEDEITITPLRGNPNSENEGYAKLFDGDNGTKWCSSSNDENGCYVIFKLSESKAMTGYTLVDGEDTNKYYGRHWKAWTIYGANFSSDAAATKDATGWTKVDSRSNQSFNSESTETAFTLSNAKAYKYYKVVIDNVGQSSYMKDQQDWNNPDDEYTPVIEENMQQMAEMQFTWSADSGEGEGGEGEGEDEVEITLNPISGNPNSENEGYAKLFDGDNGTKWCSSSNDENGCYVIFKLSESKAMTGYTLVDGEDTNKYYGRHWKAWTIYGANFTSDAVATKDATEWTQVDSRSNQEYNSASTETAFTLSNAKAYKYYKVVINEVGVSVDVLYDEYADYYNNEESKQQMAEMKFTWAAEGGSGEGGEGEGEGETPTLPTLTIGANTGLDIPTAPGIVYTFTPTETGYYNFAFSEYNTFNYDFCIDVTDAAGQHYGHIDLASGMSTFTPLTAEQTYSVRVWAVTTDESGSHGVTLTVTKCDAPTMTAVEGTSAEGTVAADNQIYRSFSLEKVASLTIETDADWALLKKNASNVYECIAISIVAGTSNTQSLTAGDYAVALNGTDWEEQAYTLTLSPSILPSGSALAMGENHVTLAESEYATYTFTPAETGYYLIYSGSESGDIDMYIDAITLEGGSDIEKMEDQDNGNFKCLVKLTAANTYNITIYNDYGGAVEDCNVCVEKAPVFIYTATADMQMFFNYAYQYKVLCEEYTDGETPVTVALFDKVTSIGQTMFFCAGEFTSIALPSGVTSIGQGAFQTCSGLTSITLPDGLQSIGEMAFNDCPNLTSITLPSGVTSIGNFAFGECTALANVAFNSVPLVGGGAFANCPANIEYTLTLTDNSYVYTSAVNFFPTTVASATYTRQMSNAWGTVVVPFTISYNPDNGNYKLYKLTGAEVNGEEGTLTFTEYDNNASIAAGTPMAIKAVGDKTDGKYTVTLTANGTAVNTAITPNAAVDGFTMKGTYEKIASKVSDAETSVYFIAQNKFWWAESAISIAPFRAWFETPASSGGTDAGEGGIDDVKSFDIVVEDETNGISNVQFDNLQGTNGKYMENGRIVIRRNGKKFNLNGQALR